MSEHFTTFLADDEIPDTPHGSTKYHNFAMALKGNLGMWAPYPAKLANPRSRATHINSDAYGALPCYDFEAKVYEGTLYVRYFPEELREDNPGRREKATQAPRPTTTTSTWATLLFERVGPERADVVYRVLSKIFHPDMPSGDTELQRELNQAKRPQGTL